MRRKIWLWEISLKVMIKEAFSSLNLLKLPFRIQLSQQTQVRAKNKNSSPEMKPTKSKSRTLIHSRRHFLRAWPTPTTVRSPQIYLLLSFWTQVQVLGPLKISLTEVRSPLMASPESFCHSINSTSRLKAIELLLFVMNLSSFLCKSSRRPKMWCLTSHRS